jgi:hypothetical protein
MLKKMQEGGGFMLYPHTMLHDSDCRLDLNVVQCPSKTIIVVNNCLVCALDSFLIMILLLLIVAIHITCFILHTMWVFTYFTRLLIIEHFTLLGYNMLVFDLWIKGIDLLWKPIHRCAYHGFKNWRKRCML